MPTPAKVRCSWGNCTHLIKYFPDLNLILAHWGGGLFFFNLLKKEFSAALKNVYFDTAASPYLYRQEIYRLAAEIIGPEKILFGSDYPLLPPSRYLKEMAAGGLSPEHQELMTSQNALKIIGNLNVGRESAAHPAVLHFGGTGVSPVH